MGTTTWVPGSGSGTGTPGRSTGTGTGGRHRRDGAARHSIPLGRVAGVRLEIHWSFLLLLGLVVIADWSAGPRAIGTGLLWLALLFASVVVHEVAHCVVARRRGGSVLGILLLPIGGMSRMDRMPSAPADEAAVAVAGPATSLLLGVAFLLAAAIIGSTIWPPALFAGSWLASLGWLNLLLGAFNLLPALPMDGGRLLRAGLSRRRSKFQATRIASAVARALAVGLVVVGVFWDAWLVLIGIFVFVGAAGELAQAAAEERSRQGWGPRWGGGPQWRNGGGTPWGTGAPYGWPPPRPEDRSTGERPADQPAGRPAGDPQRGPDVAEPAQYIPPGGSWR